MNDEDNVVVSAVKPIRVYTLSNGDVMIAQKDPLDGEQLVIVPRMFRAARDRGAAERNCQVIQLHEYQEVRFESSARLAIQVPRNL